MPTTTVEKEILELEDRYWEAIKARNIEDAMRLTDFPCLVAGASGVGLIDKETFRKMMSSAGYTLRDFEIKDAKVSLPNDDVALVAYKVHEDLGAETERLRTTQIAAGDSPVRPALVRPDSRGAILAGRRA